MTKAPVIERLNTQITALNAIVVTDENTTSAKGDVLESIRKSSTGFGNLSDHVQEAYDAVKALHEQGGTKLAAKSFASKEDYRTAVDNYRMQAIPVIENLLAEVSALDDSIGEGESESKGTGSRTKFILHATHMDTNEKVELTTGQISEGFIKSEAFKQLENTRGLSDALKAYFSKELRITWEEQKSSASIFYQIYRQIRPTVGRALGKRNAAVAEAASDNDSN